MSSSQIHCAEMSSLAADTTLSVEELPEDVAGSDQEIGFQLWFGDYMDDGAGAPYIPSHNELIAAANLVGMKHFRVVDDENHERNNCYCANGIEQRHIWLFMVEVMHICHTAQNN